MASYSDVMRFLNEVEANLNGDKMPIKGGGDSTEPYGTYETFLNNIFGYTKFVYENNDQNKKELANSIDELDKCRKHKQEICKDETEETENTSMVTSPIDHDEIHRGNRDDNDEYDGVLLLKGKSLE